MVLHRPREKTVSSTTHTFMSSSENFVLLISVTWATALATTSGNNKYCGECLLLPRF